MKKVYQIPTAEITKIELQQMIAESMTITKSETNYDGFTQIESRSSGSIWDEDEEY